MNKTQFTKEEIFELKLTFQLLEDNGYLSSKKVYNFISNLRNKERENEVYINKSLFSIFNAIEEEIKVNKIDFENFLHICKKYIGKNTPEEDFKNLVSLISDINDPEMALSKEKLLAMLKEYCGEDLSFSDEDYLYFYKFYFQDKEQLCHNDLKTLYYK